MRTLNPDYPIVSGEYRLTSEWSLRLPGSFNRRFEDGQLVLWRPGFTIWCIIWNNDHGESTHIRLASLRDNIAAAAREIQVIEEPQVIRLLYRLDEVREERAGATVYALYAYIIGQRGHVQIAYYADSIGDLSMARSIVLSIAESSAH